MSAGQRLFGWLFVATVATNAVTGFEFQATVSNPVYANPDAYGYRYCAYWKLADGTRLWSTCDKFEFERCGRRIEFEYRCCTQFKQVPDTVFPMHSQMNVTCCARVVPQWDFCPNVVSTQSHYVSFSKYLNFGPFKEEQPLETYTIFAPFSTNPNDITNLYASYKDLNWKHPVANLIVKNRIYGADLRDGQVLETMGGAKLKVTKYSFGVTCIECSEIMEADLECRNGIVHFLRKFIYPSTGLTGATNRASIMALLLADSRTKSFASALPKAMQDLLSDVNSGQWYTVLAPNQESWVEIRKKYSGDDLAKLAQNHVLPKMYCATGLIRHVRALNTLLTGESVSVNCETVLIGTKYVERRYVQDSCGNKRYITEEDMMAANGVVHLVDGPLVPSSVMSLNDIFECANNPSSPFYTVSTFINFIKGCDLRMESGKKYAILMPMNYAMGWWRDYKQFEPEYKRFLADEKYRCRVARYHVVAYNPQLESVSQLWHEQSGYQSNTIDERYEVDYFLKYKWRSDLYFHFSPVVNMASLMFNGGSIFRLRRINVIPELTVMQVLESRPDLSLAYERAKAVKLNETLLIQTKPLNLYLATVNRGWKAGDNFTAQYYYSEGQLRNLTFLHHVPLYLWGGDIGYFENNSYSRFMSSLGVELIFWMDANGVMRIGHEQMTDKMAWPMVIEFNLHAIDGIIWLLDGVLTCPICSALDIDRYVTFAAACNTKQLGSYEEEQVKKEFQIKPYDVANAFTGNCVIFNQRPVEVKAEQKSP